MINLGREKTENTVCMDMGNRNGKEKNNVKRGKNLEQSRKIKTYHTPGIKARKLWSFLL